MKRWISILLATVMIFSLAGCQTKNPGSDEPVKTTGEADPNTVYLLNSVLSTPEQEQAWAEVLAAFEKESGLKVEARYQGTWDEYPQILTQAKIAQEPVDVGVTGVGLVQSPLGPGGMIMDMTDLAADLTDRYEDGVLDSSVMGDRLWVLPLADGGCTCMLYNKDLFEELNLEVPKTFDEIVEIAKVIKEKKGITPMMIHGKDAWAWPMMYFDTYAQATGNKSVENVEEFLTGKKKFDGQPERDGFEYIKMLFDEGVMETDSFDTNSDGMVAAFAQEKVAMLFTLDAYIAYIHNANPELNIGVMEYPLMKKGVRSEHAFAVGDGALFIPAFIEDSRLDNAMRLIEFLTRPENADKLLNCAGPTKFRIMKDVEPGHSEINDALNELIMPNTRIYLDWLWPAEVNDAFCQAIPAVISGTLTSQEATELVQGAYDTVVKEQDYRYDWWNTFTEEQLEDITPDHIPDLKQFMK